MLGGNPSASLLQHLLFVQGWAPEMEVSSDRWGKVHFSLTLWFVWGFFHICWLGVCYVIESCAPKIVRCVLFFNWCQILWARSYLLPFVFMVNLSHTSGMSWITDYRKLGIMRGGMAWWSPVSIVASTAILRRLCCILLLKNTVFFHCRTECMVPSDSRLWAPFKLYMCELFSLEGLSLVWTGWVCAPWGPWGVGARALAQPSKPHPLDLRAQLWRAGLGRDGRREICLCSMEFGLINDLIYNPKWSSSFCSIM